MKYTVKEVLQFVEGNDVKFVRLVFFNCFGVKKNISIMASELKTAFGKGVTISAKQIFGAAGEAFPELVLVPDPNTLKVLTWRPQQGAVVRMLCDIRTPDGRAFAGDIRSVLKRAVQKAENMGFSCQAGMESSFYLFRLDDNGNPTTVPQDQGGYLDVAPLDKGENVRRQICLTLEDMDIQPVGSHHESGTGQNAIGLRSSGLLRAADDYYTMLTVIRTAAADNGLYASLLPVPIEGQNRNYLYTDLLVRKYKENIFTQQGERPGNTAAGFLAGVLRHLGEIAVFFNPQPDSYDNAKVQSDLHYTGSPLRLVETADERARLQLRFCDPDCNLYAGLALVLLAGLEGIEEGLFYEPEKDLTAELPAGLSQAAALAARSEFVRKHIPPEILSFYTGMKV